MSNGKVMIIHLKARLIKKIQRDSIGCNYVKMSQYFPKPYEPFGGDINVKVDLSNYETKADIKNISHVDTSSFALKPNLDSLKREVDKLDIDKLVPVPVDLSKLSDVVKNYVVKKKEKNEYDELVAKVNNIDTSGFVLKTNYDADKSELENKIPGTSGLVKKTDYDELKQKVKVLMLVIQQQKTATTTLGNKTDVTNLATKTALTTLENKIPDVTNLATKTTLTATENKKYLMLVALLKRQIITLELLRLILRYQVLMVKQLKIKQKMSLLKMN